MFALQGVPQLEGLSVRRRVGGWSGVGWQDETAQTCKVEGGEGPGALPVEGARFVVQ